MREGVAWQPGTVPVERKNPTLTRARETAGKDPELDFLGRSSLPLNWGFYVELDASSFYEDATVSTRTFRADVGGHRAPEMWRAQLGN